MKKITPQETACLAQCGRFTQAPTRLDAPTAAQRTICDSYGVGSESLHASNPRIDLTEERDHLRGLFPPTSWPVRASTRVFSIAELRDNIARLVDCPKSKENLALVSQGWYATLDNDAAYLRRVEKVLRLPPGTAARWQLPAHTRDMARITTNILNKKISGRSLTEEEQIFQDFLPRGAWHEIEGCLKLRDMYFSNGLKGTAKATLWIGGSVAVGFGGYKAAHWLYDHGWSQTAGYVWNAATKVYDKSMPPAFYEPHWISSGYDDSYWGVVPTPEDARLGRIELCIFLGTVIAIPGCFQAMEAFKALRESRAVGQELRDNAKAPLGDDRFKQRNWRHEQFKLRDEGPWYERFFGL